MMEKCKICGKPDTRLGVCFACAKTDIRYSALGNTKSFSR